MNEEQMERNLDRINMWIGNCDQKASFLLAFLGVSAAIFITSDVIGAIRVILIEPFIGYWRDGIGSFNFWRFLLAACLVVGTVCIFIALLNLLLCLIAKTDYSKFEQPGMKGKSRLFYSHIASMSFDKFCQDDNDRLIDLSSQTYTNACICDAKFKHYNRGLNNVILALPFLAIAFVLIFFI